MKLVTLLALSSTALATCYFPNGAKVESDTACNPSALESACCYSNQACLSNGLCVSDPHDTVIARLHRGTCTDQAWKSGNCPRECLDVNNNGVPVYSCNVTNIDAYCCYDDCECASPFEVFSFSALPSDVYTLTIIGEAFTQTHVSTTSTKTSSSTTTTSSGASASASSTASGSTAATGSSSATTPSATTTAAPATTSKSTNTTALGVGLGVGVPAAAALFVGLFFLWRRKKRSAPGNGSAENPAELDHMEGYPPHTKFAHYSDAEVQGSPAANELATDQDRIIELADTSRQAPHSREKLM